MLITGTVYYFLISRLQAEARLAIAAYLSAHGFVAEGFLGVIVSIATWLVLLLVSALTFSIVASIAASPFNDFLAESAESRARPPLPKVPSVPLSRKLWLLLIDLAKTILASFMTLLALICSWIPALNLLAFGLAFLAIAFQFLTYPQTRRGEGVRDGLSFIGNHLFSCLGFGASFSILFAIPLVSCLALPLAVVGGTLLYARETAPR